MDDKLWKVFENINRWLDFAERKNGLLVTFLGVQLSFQKAFFKEVDGWFLASIVFLGLCFLLVMVSFYPKIRIPDWLFYWADGSGKASGGDNGLFYGHIAKYSQRDYIAFMEKALGETIAGDKFREDVCGQIVINAGVADRKYRLYQLSAWLMIPGEVCFVISILPPIFN